MDTCSVIKRIRDAGKGGMQGRVHKGLRTVDGVTLYITVGAIFASHRKLRIAHNNKPCVCMPKKHSKLLEDQG